MENMKTYNIELIKKNITQIILNIRPKTLKTPR